jgi:hypothetical protein
MRQTEIVIIIPNIEIVTKLDSAYPFTSDRLSGFTVIIKKVITGNGFLNFTLYYKAARQLLRFIPENIAVIIGIKISE